MAVVVVGLVAVLAAATVWRLGQRRGPILQPVSDRLGILPTIPGETRSIDEIEAATADPAPAVRREALRSLGRLEDHRKLPAAQVLPFLTKGVQDTDGGVRAVATAYLGKVRVEAGLVVPLLVALLDDADPNVRMNAANGLRLRESASREAVPRLLEALSDANREVRISAARALFDLSDARYEPPQEWRGLSAEEATAQARGMGLLVTGDSLLEAVKYDDAAGVFVLLKAGVDPNSRNARTPAAETPLFLVATRRPEIVRYLLDAGADVHARDRFGRTAWDWVKDSGGPYADEMRQILRQAGAAP